jgi:hypothetical protein
VGGITKSLLEVSVETNKVADFYLLHRDFLEHFYRIAETLRIESIRESPMDMPEKAFVPNLAATAHKLANDNGFDVPSWVFEKRCYLPDMPDDEPYFFHSIVHGELALYYLRLSPAEFKHRNLFVCEHVLTRV